MAKKRRQNKQKIVYLAVSADELELPTAVFFSVKEIQIWVGSSYQFVVKIIKNNLVIHGCRIIKVDLKHDKKADT